jgi:hypothetical protein
MSKLTAFERASLTADFFEAFLKATSLVLGAVLISMAYQSWEVGVGVASLVFFAKLK